MSFFSYKNYWCFFYIRKYFIPFMYATLQLSPDFRNGYHQLVILKAVIAVTSTIEIRYCTNVNTHLLGE